jgi:hypothetical protein
MANLCCVKSLPLTLRLLCKAFADIYEDVHTLYVLQEGACFATTRRQRRKFAPPGASQKKGAISEFPTKGLSTAKTGPLVFLTRGMLSNNAAATGGGFRAQHTRGVSGGVRAVENVPRGIPSSAPLTVSVPCFSVSESTIALSPCMAFFIVFLIVFLLPRNN